MSSATKDLPRRFGRYTLLRVLGEGGMGRVFAAELRGPAGFRKRVAIKVLRPDLSVADPMARTSLAHEARLGGLLSHPNIVETYELGQAEGQLFVAMALVRGASLHDLLCHAGPLSARATLELATQAAAGLAHIHEVQVDGRPAGLIHRDLKPANILVDQSGLVRVADLGIAALREAVGLTSDRRGTPAYMSPEQIVGDALDARSDLFSLGTVIVECLTGTNPFARETPAEMLHALLGADLVVDADILQALEAAAPDLGELVRELLHVDPSRRPGSASDLHQVLREFARAASGEPLADLISGDMGTAQLHRSQATWNTMVEVSADTAHHTPPATNIKAEPNAFIGRAADLIALHERVDSSRLVTVKGAGGTGKTRLSKRYGVRHLESWTGGVWFCDLTEAHNRQSILFAVAQVLSVPFGRGDDDALSAQLGRAIATRGRVLLILDNFEHLVEFADETVGSWLGDAPLAHLIVTSRERLRLAGEVVFELAPLEVDDAIRLLQERAGGSEAWGENTPVLNQIVKQLDQLPLAIELAAARARHMSPSQVLKRLDNRLRLLRGGVRGAPARQATLRGAIDWSWALLEPWEQAALAQLSVFRGGFTLDDAEEVLDVSDWTQAPWEVDVVGSLWDKSLLVSHEVRRQPRFRMYETIREYAAEKLGDDPTVRDRHAMRYSRLGTDEALRALGTGQVVNALSQLTREIDNLVAAATHATARGLLRDASRCARAAAEVFERRGPLRAGLELIDPVLAAGPERADTLALLNAGRVLALLAGLADGAEQYAKRALALSPADGDPGEHANALYGIAALLQTRGDAAAAAEHAREAVALCPPTDQSLLTRATGLLGRIHTDLGRLDEAERLLSEAITIARALDNRTMLGVHLVGLGLVVQHLGRADEAQAYLIEAIGVLGELDDAPRRGRAHGNLGILLRRKGHMTEARFHYETALRIYRQVGSMVDEAIVLLNLGILHYVVGDVGLAEEHHRASIAVNERGGNLSIEAGNLSALGIIRKGSGDLIEARRLFETALARYLEAGNRHYQALTMCDLAAIDRDEGRLVDARGRLEKAIAILSDVGDVVMWANATRTLGETWTAVAAYDRAEELVNDALAGIADAEVPEVEGKVRQSLAMIAKARGDLDAAEEHNRVAAELGRAGGNAINIAACHVTMASIHLARQAPSRAIEELDSAHALDGKLDVGMRAELAKLRGLALLQLDRSEEAASALQQALTLLSDAGQPLTLAKVHLTRAEHATALGIDPRPDLEAVTAMPAVQALPPESQQRTNLQRLATLTSGLDPPQEG